MSRLTEWTEVEPTEATPAPKCPVGMLKHRWELSIEDGQPTLGLAEGEVCVRHDFGAGEVNVCEEDLTGYRSYDPDALVMLPIPVSIAIFVEHQADEVYGWLEITPDEGSEG